MEMRTNRKTMYTYINSNMESSGTNDSKAGCMPNPCVFVLCNREQLRSCYLMQIVQFVLAVVAIFMKESVQRSNLHN